MSKSIDAVVQTQVNWKVHPHIKKAIETVSAEEHTSQIGWIIKTLMKDPDFRRHLESAKEVHGTSKDNQEGSGE